MGRLKRGEGGAAPRSGPSGLVRALLLGACLLGLASCSSTPEPRGFYYAVQPGDNLYRIGKRFGVPARTLIEVNRIDDVHSVSVGTRLYIPAQRPSWRG